MKKIISIVLVLFTLVSFFNLSFISHAEQMSSLNAGYTGVSFSNGYTGFCIDASKAGASVGDEFSKSDNTNVANNNVSGTNVSQKLKLLFVLFFEDIFVSDNNGGYVIDKTKADTSVQSAIWHFTDNRYIWGEGSTFVQGVNSYTGPEIPDEGHTITLENSDVIKFSFMVFEPENEDIQSFFAYKIEKVDTPTHQHVFGNEWKSDGEKHWHECSCGEKSDEDDHDGTTANCITPSKCEECNKQLSDVDKDNHTGNTELRNQKPAEEFEEGYTGDTYCSDCGALIKKGEEIPATHQHVFGNEWKSDGEKHWHECSCGEKTDEDDHDGTTANCITPSKCEECNKQLSDVDKDNHTGNTELRNQKPAEGFKEGYTGDTYCSDCGVLLIKGEKIAANTPSYDEENSKVDTGNEIEIILLLCVLFISISFTTTAVFFKRKTK